MTTLSRSCWAAIGAAIAVTLGLARVGTVQLVGAEVSSGERAVFVPLTPVRILDTRDGTGGITGPIAAGGSFELQVTGVGGVPADATGVVMNVTGTEATDLSFITVWPAGEPRPNASNLNLTPGQNLPNLVTVKLGAGGRLGFYNYAGTTHLAADVAGYYVGHNHDDRYYTKAEVDALLGGYLTAGAADAAYVPKTELGCRAASCAGATSATLAPPSRCTSTTRAMPSRRRRLTGGRESQRGAPTTAGCRRGARRPMSSKTCRRSPPKAGHRQPDGGEIGVPCASTVIVVLLVSQAVAGDAPSSSSSSPPQPDRAAAITRTATPPSRGEGCARWVTYSAAPCMGEVSSTRFGSNR